MANVYTIQELVAFAKGNDEEQKNNEFEFGSFGNAIAQTISADTGVNIIGAIKLVKPYGIAHILSSHAGIKEIERGQRPITDSDFDLIPDIVNRHDSYERASDNKRGEPGLYFHKVIGKYRYTVCLTFTQKRNRLNGGFKKKLTVSTMFKHPS